jgi:hypothetical protein
VVAAINGGWVAGVPWPPSTWSDNLAHLPSTVINLGLFLGPAALLAIAGFSRAPAFARRALIAAVPVLVGFLVFGYWWDVTRLTWLYPLLAPLLLSSLFEPITDR